MLRFDNAVRITRRAFTLMELLVVIAILGVLLWFERTRRPFPGRTFWSYLLLYAVSRFVIEFFRGDIASHSPNTLVLSRCIVCRSAPPMGGDGGGTNDDASTVDGVGFLTGPVYRTSSCPGPGSPWSSYPETRYSRYD